MKKITTFLQKLRPITLILILLLIFGLEINAQTVTVNPTCVSATATAPGFATDFDSLANTGTSSSVPSGFGFSETGTSATVNGQYTAGTGSSGTGDTYSFGIADGNIERAFGTLLSGTNAPMIGACIVNNTGGTLNSITITYDGEQWRLGATGRTDRLDFQYSLDATSLTTGTWIDVDALDFNAPNSTGTTGARDGNDPANRTAGITSNITSLTIPDGSTFYVRFLDFNATGSDDGLAIDNFSILGFPNLASSAQVGGRIVDSNGNGISKVQVKISGGELSEPIYALTSPFGYYSFEVPAGQTYIVSVGSKNYTFSNPSRVINVNDNVTDLDFTADAP